MWGMILICFIVFSVSCLLGFASEKTMDRNWIACVALIAASVLGYMTGKS